MEPFYPQTILELEDHFATDDACREYLTRLRWPNGFVCPRCGHQGGWTATRGRLICQSCRHQTSVTSGTIFQGTHKPLRLWFQAIWQVTSPEHVASARDVQQILGVRYPTARAWMHKLRRAAIRPEQDRLFGRVEVDLTWISDSPEGRNGRETDKPFVFIAAEENDSGTGRIRMSRTISATRKSLRKFLGTAIEPGSIVRGYGFVGERDARAVGCHYATVLFDGDQDAATELLPRLRRIETSLHRWLSGTDHGAVHRNHLDSYLDEFTSRFNRRDTLSRGELFHQMLQESLATPTAAGGGVN